MQNRIVGPHKILRGKRILVVDDEEDILDLVEDLLECARSTRHPAFRRQKDSWRTTSIILLSSTSWRLRLRALGDRKNTQRSALMLTAHA